MTIHSMREDGLQDNIKDIAFITFVIPLLPELAKTLEADPISEETFICIKTK